MNSEDLTAVQVDNLQIDDNVYANVFMTHVPLVSDNFAFALAPVTQYTALTPHEPKQDARTITFLIDHALHRNCTYIYLQLCNCNPHARTMFIQEFTVPVLGATEILAGDRKQCTIDANKFCYTESKYDASQFKQGWHVTNHGEIETCIVLQKKIDWDTEEGSKHAIEVPSVNPYCVLLQSATSRL